MLQRNIARRPAPLSRELGLLKPLLQVLTCAEGFAAAGEDENPQAGVDLEPLESGAQILFEGVGHAVHGLRAIEGEMKDMRNRLGQEEVWADLGRVSWGWWCARHDGRTSWSEEGMERRRASWGKEKVARPFDKTAGQEEALDCPAARTGRKRAKKLALEPDGRHFLSSRPKVRKDGRVTRARAMQG